MMNSTVALAVCVALASVALAQEELDPKKGWLEGRVHNEDGEPVRAWVYYGSDFVTAGAGMDGLYMIKNLNPGTYELQVKEVPQGYRPQRIFGVLVKPGVRTVLDITLTRGKGLQEIGKPAFVTEKVVLVSDALGRLHKTIDDLLAQVNDLKAQVKELKAKQK